MITTEIRDFKILHPITLGCRSDWKWAQVEISGLPPGSRCDGKGLIVGAYNWNVIYLREVKIGSQYLLSEGGEVDGMIYSSVPNLESRLMNGIVIAIEFRYTGYVPVGMLGGEPATFTSIYRSVILNDDGGR